MTTYHTLRDANKARHIEWMANGAPLPDDFREVELLGEVGEVANVVKKLVREDLGLPGSRATTAQLAEELADVLICIDLAQMDHDLNENLPDFIVLNSAFWTGGTGNVQALYSRLWGSGYLPATYQGTTMRAEQWWHSARSVLL